MTKNSQGDAPAAGESGLPGRMKAARVTIPTCRGRGLGAMLWWVSCLVALELPAGGAVQARAAEVAAGSSEASVADSAQPAKPDSGETGTVESDSGENQGAGSDSTKAAASGAVEPSPEAMLAEAIDTFENRRMREGLEQLEGIVALRPDWRAASRAYAYALLRAGRFGDAAGRLLPLIGDPIVRAVESGEATGAEVTPKPEAEDVLALAIVRAQQGAYRVADRLYRAYADIVGAASPEAARAFWRLANMYEASGVEWGDAEVARARAQAIEPKIDSMSTLPEFPDASDRSETEGPGAETERPDEETEGPGAETEARDERTEGPDEETEGAPAEVDVPRATEGRLEGDE